MKTKLLVLLLSLVTVAGYAQQKATYAEIRQAITAAAPHIPNILRYSGDGTIFHVGDRNYKFEMKAQMQKWAADYPAELENFRRLSSPHVHTEGVGLSPNETETLYDIKAQWTMLAQVKHWSSDAQTLSQTR